MRWTPESKDLAKKLWLEGKTGGEIAGVTGRSRAAICALMFRLNLRKTAGTGKGRTHSAASYAKGTAKRRASMGIAPGKTSAPKFSALPLPEEDAMPQVVLKMEDMEPHHCRWIYGTVGSQKWGFCGQDREGPHPYCQNHTKRAYTTVYVPSRAIQNAECNRKIARAKRVLEEGVE